MPELKKEQEQAVFHNDGNILVSASAGSGKTFVMIERLIRLITEGRASVKQILAVTFTELAASEMKEKLKIALTKKISETGDKRLIRELAEIPTADISTMHAFCARLIRSYFYKVGLAPDFKILDDGGAGALKNESVNLAFRELYESGEEWFKILLSRHSVDRSDESFKATIIRMSEAGLVNADADIYLKRAKELYSEQGFKELLSGYKKELNQKLDTLIERAKEGLRIFKAENKPKLVEFIESLISDMQSVLDSADVYAVKRDDGYKKDLPRGLRFTGELKEVYESVVGVRNEFKALLDQANNGLTDSQRDLASLANEREHLLGLFRIVARYDEIYARLKREENGLDFSDLEHFALEILKDEEIKSAVSDKYKYIFVDEYQDTNGVQEALISAIAKDNLFMVGDAKQSIYGFRGCRPEIFIDKLNQMSASGQKTVLLNHNFRSCDGVIDFVNKVFSYSMTKEYFGMSYKDTSMLRAGGTYDSEHCGRCELHLLKNPPRQAKEMETPRIYDLLQEINKPTDGEILPTPTLIASIIESELKKEYYDAKLKISRPITYGDIAILTRNKDNKYVRDIVKTLVGYGVPVVSVVKENICDYPEIRSLISALKLIDCFNQDIPLASVLKSPVGNFTDEELAQIVLYSDDRSGFYNAFINYIENADTPLKDRLKEFYEYFNGVRLISDFVGAHGALKRLVSDKNIEQNLYAQPNGRLKVKRLRRFISASVVEGNALSVKDFLSRIERFPSAFGLSDGAEENSVKLMTIHASKGLEFPVVIVCGLERHANSREEREELTFDQDLGFAVKSYNDKERTSRETPVRMIFRTRMRENRLKEELRLFYVALTRAVYSLHLTFSGSKDGRSSVFSGANKFLDYVPRDIELTEHTVEEFALMGRSVETKKVLVGSPDEKTVEQMKNNFSYAYPFEADTLLPLKNSVTKATSQTTEQERPVHILFDEDAPDIEKGNIAHKLMELYDFESDKTFSEKVIDIIKSGALTKEQVELVNLERIQRATLSPVFELIKGKKLYREKDFIVTIEADKAFNIDNKESVLLQGVIDLLAVGETAVIIDYKYSSLEISSLKAKYSKQLDLYAYALEKAVGIKVQKKALVNLFTGDSAIFD